jgi:hypothetical protein
MLQPGVRTRALRPDAHVAHPPSRFPTSLSSCAHRINSTNIISPFLLPRRSSPAPLRPVAGVREPPHADRVSPRTTSPVAAGWGVSTERSEIALRVWRSWPSWISPGARSTEAVMTVRRSVTPQVFLINPKSRSKQLTVVTSRSTWALTSKNSLTYPSDPL